MRSIGVSAVVHATLILVMALYSLWSYKPKIILPGYTVNLVTPETLKPHSLLEPEKPAPKKPRMKKKSYPKKKKKKRLVAKKKIKTKAKKIVPKKKRKKPLPAEKKRVREPVSKKKLRKKQDSASAPKKTIVTEGQAFPYMWYLKIIERKVQESWITHGIDITGMRENPVVRFRVQKNGAVAGLTIEKSSGSVPLDASALEAVTRAQPFPPLPEGYKGDSLGVHFGFSYEQRER